MRVVNLRFFSAGRSIEMLMKNIISQIKDELQVSLRETDPESCKILAVYLFGSSMTSGAGRNSDLDLAFLLNDKGYKVDPLAAVVPAYLVPDRKVGSV